MIELPMQRSVGPCDRRLTGERRSNRVRWEISDRVILLSNHPNYLRLVVDLHMLLHMGYIRSSAVAYIVLALVTGPGIPVRIN